MNAPIQNATVLKMPDTINAAVRELAAQWGWSNPKEDILALALKAKAAEGKMVGDILVDWEVIDAVTRDQLLRAQPEGEKLLKYMSDMVPDRVLPYVEKVLALQNAVAFYERLDVLTEHAGMRESDVIGECKVRDAALMLIEATRPVLVFSSWEAMLAFERMPPNTRATNAIVKACAGKPILAVGPRDDISHVLALHASALEDGKSVVESSTRQWNVRASSDTPRHESELARVFDHGLSIGASDVAFMPLRDGRYEVRLRRFGRLIEPFRGTAVGLDGKTRKVSPTIFNPDMANKAVNLLLSKSNAGKFINLREPVDGQINYKSTHADAFFRLNFIPLNHLGDYKQLRSVSVRLFSRKEQAITFSELSMPTAIAGHIRDAMRMQEGLVLLSGPTNSGKSTTIAAAISEHYAMFGDELKRLSLEDPIERHLPGIRQINVAGHLDEKERFAVVQRAAKRHDPDLFWMGEVRDAMSAEFCVNFAVTGHLALSSLHAKNARSAYEILSLSASPDMRYQVIEAMNASIAQRLVPKVCPHCSGHFAPTPEEVRRFDLSCSMKGEIVEIPDRIVRIHRPDGCEECDRGYIGEVPLMEYLPFTSEVKDAALDMLNRENMKENKKFMNSKRLVSLQESGLERMAAGEVALESILFI